MAYGSRRSPAPSLQRPTSPPHPVSPVTNVLRGIGQRQRMFSNPAASETNEPDLVWVPHTAQAFVEHIWQNFADSNFTPSSVDDSGTVVPTI